MPYLNIVPPNTGPTSSSFALATKQLEEVLICNFVGAPQERYESLAGSVRELARFGRQKLHRCPDMVISKGGDFRPRRRNGKGRSDSITFSRLRRRLRSQQACRNRRSQ